MSLRFLYIFLAASLLMAPLRGAGKEDSLMALLDTSFISRQQVELRLRIADEIANADIRQALYFAQEALSQAEMLGAISLVAEAKLSIGQFYDYLGVKEEAIEFLMEALEVFVALEEKRNEARTLMLIGNAYWYLHQFESALKYYNHASILGNALKDTSLIIRGINARAAVYGNTGQMDSALILFKEARDLAMRIGNKELVILTYYNIGDVNLYSGRIDDALGIFHDLENNYDLENQSSKHLSNLYNSITLAHILNGDLKWAKRYSELTRTVLDSYSRLTETREYHHNKYRIDSIEGNIESALLHYSRFTQLNDSLNNAAFQNRLANLEIFFDLRAKEGEIEQLTLDNQYKDLNIRQRQIINTASAIGIILLLIILFLLVRSAIKTRERSTLLEAQKDELERANLKISAQSMDLLDKNNELESLIEELKATQQHLVQSEKMASLGTLTAGVAHEINNPLNFISGGLGIILEAEKEDSGLSDDEKVERRKKATQLAMDGVERATVIVKALMTFSRRGSSKKSPSDLHDIIDNTLLFLQSKLIDHIEIRKDYQLTQFVPVFQDKMHQVILNLIDNAIFAVNLNKEGERMISIATKKEGPSVVLDISNNGPAIKKEHLNQLFDPFFTTKDPGKGTGLGLSISYNLIADHNGNIRAENRGDAVHFIIRIPA